MLHVSAAEVDRALTFPGLVETLREAFRAGAVQPVRHHHTVERPDGAASTTPGHAFTSALFSFISAQETAALVLAAVGEKGGCHLPVGDPVGGDRGTVGQEFLGDDVAVHVAAPVAAVLDGDGQPDEAGRCQPHAEVGVPLRQPAVDAGLPAELRSVLGQEPAQVVA